MAAGSELEKRKGQGEDTQRHSPARHLSHTEAAALRGAASQFSLSGQSTKAATLLGRAF